MRSLLSCGPPRSHGNRLFPVLAALISFASIAPAAPARAQTSDVTPPQLVDFTFTPMSIDVSSGSQVVTATLHITDDLAGAGAVQVGFRDPISGQSQVGFALLTSGTTLDGTYTATITFPQFAADGNWIVNNVFMQDLAGNNSNIGTAVLNSLGFPTILVVTSTPDTQPPTLAGLTITPGAVDVSAGGQLMNFTLRLVDDIAGVGFNTCASGTPFPFTYFPVTLSSPSGQQLQFIEEFVFSSVSGTPLDGTWQGELVLPQYSEAGTWRIQQLQYRDCAGNFGFANTAQIQALGLPATFDVTSNPQDVQPPDLTGFSFQPIAINTSTSNQLVTVRLTITDDIAGAAFTPTTNFLSFFEAGVQFRSPSGSQVRCACFFTPYTLISGTPLSGTWEANAFFQQFSEAGTWHVDLLQIKDGARNFHVYNQADLEALGFPTELEVIRPSLISDGTVGTGGGTVEDDTFGPRASVTLPPGAVSGPTDVAIDVLPNPLAIPTPTGFQGPGSLYVNIELTPTPAFPLAPPGIEVTLPLPNQLAAGTALNLYKVDTATGMLVPAIDVFGAPVVGFVDANGLSATFTGIASLSTIVGLLPDAIPVNLDIRPGSADNPINLGTRGTVPVAILGTPAFDVHTIDIESVLFAGTVVRTLGNGRPQVSYDDVNLDGLTDLVMHFDLQSLNLLPTDTDAWLVGLTDSGIIIMGKDTVRIVK